MFQPILQNKNYENRLVQLAGFYGLLRSPNCPATRNRKVEMTEAMIRVRNSFWQREEQEHFTMGIGNLEGGKRKEFVRSDLRQGIIPSNFARARWYNFPRPIVLSCVDSRVPVEDVFDRGIGDHFVARVAGILINEIFLEVWNFATRVAGAKLMLILGQLKTAGRNMRHWGAKLGHIQMLKKHSTDDQISTIATGPRSSLEQIVGHEVVKQRRMRDAKDYPGKPVT